MTEETLMESKGTGEGQQEPEDEERVHELFELLDGNNDGLLDGDELSAMFLQSTLPPAAVKQILSRYGGSSSSSSHTLTYDQFAITYKGALALFRQLDADGNGQLDKSELRAAMISAGLSDDALVLDSMFDAADLDGDHLISFEEFFCVYEVACVDKLADLLSFWSTAAFTLQGAPIIFKMTEHLNLLSSVPGWHLLLAGGLGGAISKTLTAPLSRISIIMQVAKKGAYTSSWDVFKSSMKQGGVLSLFRGNLATVLKIAPSAAINLGTYEKIKNALTARNGRFDIGSQLVAGGLSGTVSLCSTYPLDIIKSHLATNVTARSKSMGETARFLVARDGFSGLFKGLPLALLEAVPNVALHFAVYERLKKIFVPMLQSGTGVSLFPIVVSSASSALISSTATYPMTLIAKQIVTQQGLRGLYRGILPYYAQVIPGISISFSIFEKTKGFLRKRHQELNRNIK